jgi:uncharacterized protein
MFTLEHAVTEQERQWGLMDRQELAEDHGMLFHFADSQQRTVWMLNCWVDLDVAFVTSDGIITEVYTLQAHPEWMPSPLHCPEELASLPASVVDRFLHSAVTSQQPARYLLEMGGGWFARHDLQPPLQLTWEGGCGSIRRAGDN